MDDETIYLNLGPDSGLPMGEGKEIIHGITHQNEPEPGQPFGSDPTYHYPEEIYQRPRARYCSAAECTLPTRPDWK